MSIEEQIEVISTGSALYTNIKLLLDLIQEADLSMFVNAWEGLEASLLPSLKDARDELYEDMCEAKERLENGGSSDAKKV